MLEPRVNGKTRSNETKPIPFVIKINLINVKAQFSNYCETDILPTSGVLYYS